MYVKDTSDFVKKVRDVQEDTRHTILVSMDVKPLYSNIPNHERIESVKQKPNVQTEKSIATKVIIKFLF